jgi:hypothetical protein
MKPPDEDDDLFEKLDQLISRHQARTPLQGTDPSGISPSSPPVPTLTEAVDQRQTASTPEIPVLEEAVDPESAAQWAAGDRRRQLQVALYLRLRQRLDQQIEALAQGRPFALDAHFVRLVQALRDALPAIVRESVEQVLGRNEPPG